MADGAKTLTIDFKRLFKVCAVKTAGIQYQDGRDSYISSFDVSFSVDGLNWNTYPTVKLLKSCNLRVRLYPRLGRGYSNMWGIMGVCHSIRFGFLVRQCIESASFIPLLTM